MKRVFVVGLLLLVSACGDVANVGFFAPRAVDGDDSHVVIYDANGIVPQAALNSANAYCSKFGKTATLAHSGGDSYECISKQLNYCATFVCK